MKDYNEELAHRKRKRRVNFVLGVAFFCIAASAALTARLLFFTDFFYFTRLELVGAGALKKDEVFSKNKISFFEHLAVANPLVEASEIRRDYFSKTLSVIVREREPYGVWCEAALLPALVRLPIQSASSTEIASSTDGTVLEELGNCFWFDKNGIAFAKSPEVEGVLLREVNAISGQRLNPGDFVLADEPRAMLFKIFNFIDTLGIGVKQFSVESAAKQEVTAFTEAGPPIYFSLRLDPAFAVEPFRANIASILPTLQYLDLRSENKIFYR